jgi:hypothetical protein
MYRNIQSTSEDSHRRLATHPSRREVRALPYLGLQLTLVPVWAEQ